ncbi:hypothetical protein FRB91_009629 [Serendipita sp. 411]|nr:hypothetical protein FRC18_009713 [Serendipita sp. 400]KAG8849749.1 hypothetical protein FRB91_009629 [Serendipita sp. 411]
MGAKDLYLLQIVQYSSDENEKKPSHWAFFIHYTDKAGNLTGEGELHEVVVSSPKGPRYLQRSSNFLTPTFRGACTLGLFYKKNLYKIVEELETGTAKLRALNGDLKKIPQVWVENRLEAMRRAGVVVLGPSFPEMVRTAYQSWRVHRDERKNRSTITTTTTEISSSMEYPGKNEHAGIVVNLPESAAEVIKRHYSYPFTLYAAS